MDIMIHIRCPISATYDNRSKCVIHAEKPDLERFGVIICLDSFPLVKYLLSWMVNHILTMALLTCKQDDMTQADHSQAVSRHPTVIFQPC